MAILSIGEHGSIAQLPNEAEDGSWARISALGPTAPPCARSACPHAGRVLHSHGNVSRTPPCQAPATPRRAIHEVLAMLQPRRIPAPARRSALRGLASQIHTLDPTPSRRSARRRTPYANIRMQGLQIHRRSSWFSPCTTSATPLPRSPAPAIEHVSATFAEGWCGVIGDNGCGKSTLARIACGLIQPDIGSVFPQRTATYCPQDAVTSPDLLYDFACDFSRHAIALRENLGIEDDMPWRFDELSFGERKKIQVAVALWQDARRIGARRATMNHVDAPCRAAIAQALKGYRGIGILVSHDRELLNAPWSNAASCSKAEPGPCAREPTTKRARSRNASAPKPGQAGNRQARGRTPDSRSERAGPASRANGRPVERPAPGQAR